MCFHCVPVIALVPSVSLVAQCSPCSHEALLRHNGPLVSMRPRCVPMDRGFHEVPCCPHDLLESAVLTMDHCFQAASLCHKGLLDSMIRHGVTMEPCF